MQGEIEIETEGRSTFYGPGGAWFESGPDPVVARASAHLETSFVRALVLPAEWAGKRTIRYLEPTDGVEAEAVRCRPPRARDRASAVSRPGGRILVDQLALHGVDLAFGVPGESYIDVLDALLDSPIRYVTCRHEAGAANMAEAYGKLTGRPGICLVTRGPGATQASVGVHTAFQDGTPLLLLVGQIPRRHAEREAFQEIDYRRMFGPLTKWVAEVDHAERIPELVARAFRVATSGRPGPVVLALPEDMLVGGGRRPRRVPVCRSAGRAGPGRPRAASGLSSPRPSVPSRSSAGSPGARPPDEALATWCEAGCIPVAAAWRCQDYVDNDAGCYAGHLGLGADPALLARLREADVLLVVGGRLGDIETAGYSAIVPPGSGRTLVHVHPDPDEIGRVYEPDARDRRIRASLRAGPGGARPRRWTGTGAGARSRPHRLPQDIGGPTAPRGRRDDRGDGGAPRAAGRRCDPHERGR